MDRPIYTEQRREQREAAETGGEVIALLQHVMDMPTSFLTRDAMLARYMLSSCVSQSVSQCVCPSALRTSVRPSVCHMLVLYQNAKHKITQTTPLLAQGL